jgi:hypothetical protein
MTMSAPAQPLTLTPRFFAFLGGLLIFAVIGVAGFFLGSMGARGPAGLLAAFAMLAITAALAVWALRSGRIVLGSGILVGYALATVLSTGECTLWTQSANYGFLAGFAYYIIVLATVLVVSLVVAAGEYIVRRVNRQ